jgi:GTPase
VVEADVILHVRDVSHEDTNAQSHDVEDVLRQLGIEANEGARIIEVWNKIDRLDPPNRERVRNLAERQPGDRRPALVSALNGEGIDTLTAGIETRIAASRVVLDLALDPADGAGASWLHRHTEVLAKDMRDDGQLAMTVRVDPAKAEAVRAKFAGRPVTRREP